MSDSVPGGASGERQVPFFCPYCGEEDLVPDGPDGGGWACRSCARAFSLRYVGLTTADQGGAR